MRIPYVKQKYKVDPKAERGILVGYTDNGYRLLINTVKSNGKYKSQLVAVGCRQPRNDDEENYSPVAAMATLKTVLAVSCQFGWFIHQMDIDGAFLNGAISVEVYVGQPKGYNKGDSNVYRLEKALYGLRGSSRAWHECFNRFMTGLEFRSSDYDCCL